MFFYLIFNSTLIEKELDDKNKIVKVLIYGGISYIILHGTLFLGGSESVLYSLQKYFWLFFILDCLIMYLIHGNLLQLFKKQKKNNKKLRKKVSFSNPLVLPKNSQVKNIQLSKKKNDIYLSDSESESDSDIDTDIDLEGFKQSLNFN